MTRLTLRIFLAFFWVSVFPARIPAASAADAVFLINGTVVAPDRVIPNGWLAIQDGKILSITAARPDIAGARTLTTEDIIFPGFVDLHNHPLYAVFPRWKAPRIFANRYQWRGEPAYHQTIQTPEGELVSTHFCDMDTYVEIKALAGGTTSILGIYQPADTPTVPPCVAGLARNLDWASGFYGAGVGNERLGNILGVRPEDLKLSAADVERHRAGGFDLVAVHVAEGQRTDAASQGEFSELEALGLLNAKTVVIHGGGLVEEDFAKLRRAEAAFIWSPRSNFELYGQTADISAAVRQNVTMALAPDWSPTGSTNMLAEIAYAKSVSDRQFAGLLSAKQLFEMATIVPARIARIDDKVGSLAAGLRADLFLLRSDVANPFDALAGAAPQDVTLTMVDGKPVYGALGYLTALGVSDVDGVTMCGTARAINRAALPAGGFTGVTTRLSDALTAKNIRLAGLAECAEETIAKP